MRYTITIATLFFAAGPVLAFSLSDKISPMPTVHVQKSDRLARSACPVSGSTTAPAGPLPASRPKGRREPLSTLLEIHTRGRSPIAGRLLR